MHLSRHALNLSLILFSTLLIWLFAQLEFNQWQPDALVTLFRQALQALLITQSLLISLLFIGRDADHWTAEMQAQLHLILFPAPFMALTWMVDAAPVEHIIKSLMIPTLVAIASQLLRQVGHRLPLRHDIRVLVLSWVQLMLAIAVWNYRQLWLTWIET